MTTKLEQLLDQAVAERDALNLQTIRLVKDNEALVASLAQQAKIAECHRHEAQEAVAKTVQLGRELDEAYKTLEKAYDERNRFERLLETERLEARDVQDALLRASRRTLAYKRLVGAAYSIIQLDEADQMGEL